MSMSRDSLRRLIIRSSFVFLILSSYRNLGRERLEVRIVDDQTGQPLAATLVLADGEGNP